MNRKTLTAFAIPAVLAATLGTALAAVKLVKFQIGAVRLVMPLPQGFCEPTGSMIGLAQAAAAADRQNVTVVTLLACNRSPKLEPWRNYVLIKAPIGLLNTAFSKQAGLNQMDQVFAGPNSPKFDEAMTQKIAEDSEQSLGAQVEIRGQFGYAGRDQDCVYLAGPMQGKVSGVDKVATGQIATCITVTGGRMFAVNLYEIPAVKPISELKAQARQIALSIHR